MQLRMSRVSLQFGYDADSNISYQSVFYDFGNALSANRVTERNLGGGTQPIPQGVNIDFLAAVPVPPKAAIPVSISNWGHIKYHIWPFSWIDSY